MINTAPWQYCFHISWNIFSCCRHKWFFEVISVTEQLAWNAMDTWTNAAWVFMTSYLKSSHHEQEKKKHRAIMIEVKVQTRLLGHWWIPRQVILLLTTCQRVAPCHTRKHRKLSRSRSKYAAGSTWRHDQLHQKANGGKRKARQDGATSKTIPVHQITLHMTAVNTFCPHYKRISCG